MLRNSHYFAAKIVIFSKRFDQKLPEVEMYLQFHEHAKVRLELGQVTLEVALFQHSPNCVEKSRGRTMCQARFDEEVRHFRRRSAIH